MIGLLSRRWFVWRLSKRSGRSSSNGPQSRNQQRQHARDSSRDQDDFNPDTVDSVATCLLSPESE